MNAHELRIGNYILKNDKLHYCSWMTIRDIKTQSIEEDDKFEPIPLTEEWLLKFGFEINETYCSKKINKTNEFNIMFFDDGWLLCDCDIHCKIKYVHQLQNLFWILCGEELTIKN